MQNPSNQVNPLRVRRLNRSAGKKGPVVYWMSRDQRTTSNWALRFALETAERKGTFVVVAFCLMPEFLGATFRQYHFMIEGLKGVDRSLREKNIPFYLLTGNPVQRLPEFIRQLRAGILVSEFDPLKIKRAWKHAVVKNADVAIYEVDAHNIVPCLEASDRQEYSARSFRIKLSKKLSGFLDQCPEPYGQKYNAEDQVGTTDWNEIESSLMVDRSVPPVEWLKPGTSEGFKTMARFIENSLAGYARRSNDPNEKVRSDLSPYLHFGQLSAADVFSEVSRADASEEDKDSFLEQLLVRRELSDNFCFYNRSYDRVDGFPDWARATLEAHAGDPRPYMYTREQLESGDTHDELWNAAQTEMVKTGKMHGYMRMYWAKKILEWTRAPAEALDTSIYLNDRYELDGRDPNGYTGIAWSIGGVHDRAFKERSVFGKIRYMSYRGCRRKFDVDGYVSRINDLP
ncbi:MAG: deoxyribodipyrimidine photo-lyase [Actinobacteria bacterium]|nr:deoxyribodipyrimidine photo-lyase [Actinomycetota bacterium]